ncbi:major facilitator superfamily domain-containing protein [Chaetomium strumarium]|uniref:Major facilitator superfamily domain-containing protein n=1 Tax=Chaetomium strumarium TaxID=1170767 RepID=A0AAJ0GL40_9PEZI|nr:major facilitator superfamily domain-containing protein [Chaetomium strumarium]
MFKPPSRPPSSERTVLDSGPDTSSSSKRSKGEGDVAPELGQAASEQDQDPNAQPYITGFKLLIIVTCLTLILFLVILDTSIISTAIPQITNEFRSLQDVGWYASAYSVASAALQPLTGKIYQKFSLKWSFLWFLTAFEIGSLLCGVATSSTMLIVGRAVAGMGTSGIFTGGLAIVTACAPLDRRPALIGLMMGVSQIGMVSGPLIGGALTQYSTWRWCFYINLPVGGVAALYLILISLPEQTRKEPALSVLPSLYRHLDPVGFVLMAPATIQLLLALEFGGTRFPWNSATVIGLFCGAAGTFAVWFAWNWHRGDAALVPMSIFWRRTVWASAVMQMSLSAALLCTSYFLPIYFQAVMGASPLTSGVYLLPSVLSQVLGVVVSGFLVQRTGYVVPYALASAAIAAVGTGLFSLFSPTTSTGMWVGIQILAGVGRGIGLQMGMLAVQTVLSTEETSIGFALLMFAQFIGSSVWMVVASTVFNQSLASELAANIPETDPGRIIAVGATGFRQLPDLSPEDITAILWSYANATDRTFYVPAAIAALAFCVAPFMGWVDLRRKYPEAGTVVEV